MASLSFSLHVLIFWLLVAIDVGEICDHFIKLSETSFLSGPAISILLAGVAPTSVELGEFGHFLNVVTKVDITVQP